MHLLICCISLLYYLKQQHSRFIASPTHSRHMEMNSLTPSPFPLPFLRLEDCQEVRLAPRFYPASWCEEQAAVFLSGRKYCSLQWPQPLPEQLCYRHLICPFQLVALSTDSPVCLQTCTFMQICSPVMTKKDFFMLQACWHWIGLSCCMLWILPCLYQFCKRKVCCKDVAFCH